MSNDSVRFADLGLAEPVLKAIEAVGYETPSPIQAQSIPHLLDGKDILGMAQTGTGKTAAFALPLLTRIDARNNNTQVLVLAPTRELAIQVAEAFQSYAAQIKGFHVLPIYGGSDYRSQIRGLQRGAQVVVGTPGRVMDHLRRGTLKLDYLQSVVLDEADEMLRMGFIDDVTWILDQTPSERQVALFSATMPREIRKVADTYLDNPEVIKIEAQTQTVERIEQLYWLVRGVNKLDALTRILEVEEFDAIIMFVRTKNATAELAEKLEARGYSAAALNGDMSQQLRERAIERLKNGKLDIIIATDVAARGIDVARVSHVINYDIPYDTEAYVHRIGRTGRAGRSGKAILFVAPREKRMLRTIERTTSQPITELTLPSKAQVADKRITQFKQQISSAIDEQDLTFFREVLMNYAEETQAEPLDIAAALAYMAQLEKPLLQPKDIVEDKPPRRERDYDRDDHRGERRDRKRRERPNDADLETFRLEVGHNHQVKPGDIVGAIANEADIDSSFIGHIRIREDFSLVDLPKGMPSDLLAHMKKVRVRGQQMQLTRFEGKLEDDQGGYKKRPPKKHGHRGKRYEGNRGDGNRRDGNRGNGNRSRQRD
ncbi:DEAD/DEAH box helicase [Pseudomaricurvus alkylphenolicus]|jgi:ATP-dependent RNA helicase DeaD|uniref:DEAD/DEAH box helicase n=1 Tax=Pseudomaricurvus alkylphenolicus TaxID=1306991 RepID=UPI0014203472|nr:DEAD/DEAH box helicase [Pseudomaricurvus alkylphenolicus]NIB39294.1 DEAD/DEAH box helicase [Pseudomaricurvus alkylphenolicus]